METFVNATLCGENDGEKTARRAENPDGAGVRQTEPLASHVRGRGFESPHLHH